MPPVKPDWVDSPWLKSQIQTTLINLKSWVIDNGYRFTEEERKKLKAILEEGTKHGHAHED